MRIARIMTTKAHTKIELSEYQQQRLSFVKAKAGSAAEKDFVDWLCEVQAVCSLESQYHIIDSITSQIRYDDVRQFTADFQILTRKGKAIFIEWEGAIGSVKSAYRSMKGYITHADKYNYLSACGFTVIRLCNQNKITFWDLWKKLDIE